MKEKVTDISDVLLTLKDDIHSLRETIASQHSEICQLNRNIDALNVELRKRNKEIKRLKSKLSEHETPDKDSNNSSTPPSKENMKDEVIRRTKTLRKPTGRKPGGQEGHEGSTLRFCQSPDETEDITANYCTKCGESLDDCERILDYVTQVVSIPELKPVVKEIRHYTTVCKNCGERVQSHAPSQTRLQHRYI